MDIPVQIKESEGHDLRIAVLLYCLWHIGVLTLFQPRGK
jgi:hypothetical protein